jgi:hypothetical protein
MLRASPFEIYENERDFNGNNEILQSYEPFCMSPEFVSKLLHSFLRTKLLCHHSSNCITLQFLFIWVHHTVNLNFS